MSSYWDTVPKGVWTVVDPDDALAVLRDQESRAVLIRNHSGDRINVYGPVGKALILDLTAMRDVTSSQEFQQYMGRFLRYV